MSGLSTNQINHYNEKGYVSPLEALSAREANDVKDEIEYIEPDYPIYLEDVPNDPRFSELWGIKNTGQVGGKNIKDPNSGIADADI